MWAKIRGQNPQDRTSKQCATVTLLNQLLKRLGIAADKARAAYQGFSGHGRRPDVIILDASLQQWKMADAKLVVGVKNCILNAQGWLVGEWKKGCLQLLDIFATMFAERAVDKLYAVLTDWNHWVLIKASALSVKAWAKVLSHGPRDRPAGHTPHLKMVFTHNYFDITNEASAKLLCRRLMRVLSQPVSASAERETEPQVQAAKQ